MSCSHPSIALRLDKKSAYCLSCNAEMGERFAEERAENMALRFRFEDVLDDRDAEIARLKAENLRLANENAALVAQIPNGFRFPNDGDARMID